MNKKSKLLFHENEWSLDTLHRMWDVIEGIAVNKYKLDFYPPEFRLIDFDGMLNAYSTHALPGMYEHHSFGKQYLIEKDKYKKSDNLAFEVVINSNPSVCYLMDSNTATTQAIVITHAAVGHSTFFKTNHMFQRNCQAETILPFLERSSKRIKELEEKYGDWKVERSLDYIHMLGIFSYDKELPQTYISKKDKKQRNSDLVEARNKYEDKILDFTMKGKQIPSIREMLLNYDRDVKPEEPSENVLKYIVENSINISDMDRELIHIYLRINSYLYPQLHNQVSNEGTACFWHYTLMNDLYDEGYIDESSYWEFLQMHASVIYQSKVSEDRGDINPYKLGFSIYQDIRRIATNPTEEDKRFFPDWAGNGDWLSVVKHATANYKDESFITQYLSPKVIRDLKLVSATYDFDNRQTIVTSDHTEEHYYNITDNLSKNYDVFRKIPKISVKALKEEREKLFILYQDSNGRTLDLATRTRFERAVRHFWQGEVLGVANYEY